MSTNKKTPTKKKGNKKAGKVNVLNLILIAALAICAVIVIVIVSRQNKEKSAALAAEESDRTTVTCYADIEIRDYGTITLALYGNMAPDTVDNFVTLAKSGFYDGLTFHRIMNGFMMQGGDPDGNGTGGSGKNIKGEFSANGFDNPLSHKRGVISMARATDPNSASSQFFIVQSDSTFLDGNYAAFGYVTEGLDIVDKVCQDARPVDNNGTIPPEQQPVITSITIRE